MHHLLPEECLFYFLALFMEFFELFDFSGAALLLVWDATDDFLQQLEALIEETFTVIGDILQDVHLLL